MTVYQCSTLMLVHQPGNFREQAGLVQIYFYQPLDLFVKLTKQLFLNSAKYFCFEGYAYRGGIVLLTRKTEAMLMQEVEQRRLVPNHPVVFFWAFFGPVACPHRLVIYFTCCQPIAQFPKKSVSSTVYRIKRKRLLFTVIENIYSIFLCSLLLQDKAEQIIHSTNNTVLTLPSLEGPVAVSTKKKQQDANR